MSEKNVLIIAFLFNSFFSTILVAETQLIPTTSDKKAVNSKPIDMVDSGSSNSGVCNVQQPETETVISLKNDKQLLPKSNKCNDKQTTSNGAECTMPCNEQRANCDRDGENATRVIIENDATSISNYDDGGNVDLGIDDDDPYAELESYLEKVKVSF